jgi:hypothetical protein
MNDHFQPNSSRIPSAAQLARLLLASIVAFTLPTVASAGSPVATPASTTTILTLSSGATTSPTSVVQGSVLTLTAVVSASGNSLSKAGFVNFCDVTGGAPCTFLHIISSSAITGSGTAIYRFTPGPGSHTYQAVYVGTNTYATSSSTTTALTVTPYSPKLNSSITISKQGAQGSYTLSTTVKGYGATPTGTVSFEDSSNSNAVLTTIPLTAGPPILAPPLTANSSDGSRTGTVVTGDFNSDGIQDIVTFDYTGTNLAYVRLGNGDGTFTLKGTLTLEGSAGHAVVGDFNRDGNLDLAISNEFANSVQILLGKGDGTFTVAADVTMPHAYSLAVGDFNNDGIQDLIVTNLVITKVTVLNGNGDGTFTQSAQYSLAYNSGGITVGDFNRDGHLDFALSFDAADISIYLNNGDGTFTASTVAGSSVLNGDLIHTADLNGDGFADIIGVSVQTPSLTVLLGNGDGTFTAKTSSSGISAGSYDYAVADFTGDGIPDLIAAARGTTSPGYLKGNGDGTFIRVNLASVTYPVNTYGLIAATDFNGDGIPDVVVADGNYNSFPVFLTQTAATATGTATGVNPTPSGNHLVFGSYAGDTNYNSSTSTTVTLTGSKPQATVAINSIPDITQGSSSSTVTGTLTGVNSVIPGAGGGSKVGCNYTLANGYPIASGFTGSVIPGTSNSTWACSVPSSVTATLGGYIIQVYFYGDSYYNFNSSYTTASFNVVAAAPPPPPPPPTTYPLNMIAANVKITAGTTPIQTVYQLLSSYTSTGLTPDQLGVKLANAEIGFKVTGPGVSYTFPLLSYGTYNGGTLLPTVPVGSPTGSFTLTPYITGPGAANFTFTETPATFIIAQPINIIAANVTVYIGKPATQTVYQLLSSYTSPGITADQLGVDLADAELGFTVSGPGFSQNIPLLSYGTYDGANLLATVPAGAPTGSFTLTPYINGPAAANFTLTVTAGTLTIANP